MSHSFRTARDYDRETFDRNADIRRSRKQAQAARREAECAAVRERDGFEWGAPVASVAHLAGGRNR